MLFYSRALLEFFCQTRRTIFSSWSVWKVQSLLVSISRDRIVAHKWRRVYTYELQVFKGRARWLHYFHYVYKSAVDRATTRRDATQRNAMQRDTFSRSRRGSLCNTFTMQLHQRRVSPLRASVCESERIRSTSEQSQHVANERTRARTRVDRR